MEKLQEPQAPHVVFLPFPHQGHVKPMLKLAELLSYVSFQVTFINTEYVHDRFLPSIDIHAFYRQFPKFQFLSITDGLPPEHPRSVNHSPERLLSIRAATKPALRRLLVSLSPKAGPGRLQHPTCIIADGIMSSSAIGAAEEFGIPVLVFRTFSACCTWTYFHLSKLIEEGEIPLQDKDMDKLVTCIPGLENVLRRRDLPGICRVERAENPILEFFISQARAMLGASALILNTFDELERPMLSKLSSFFSKIYTIGPLHALSNVRIKDDPSSLASTKSILWKEDRGCITWLDSQPSKSVVFVSFGSIVSFTHDQMLEFWHGLVNSGKPFLWVIRPNSIIGGDDSGRILIDLEERTKGKGLIVSWAPQEEVLAHPALGGFLTHGGWNSILETIYAGVPMICWPAISDQQVNSRFVSDVWRVGFDMKDSCERSVVEKMVRDLMEDKREEIMKSMDEIAKQAQESVKEGGSSYRSLERLIEDIRTLSKMSHGSMDMPMPSSGSMSNNGMKSMDMHMSFYWGKNVTVLFSGWPESNSGMYVLALLFVLLLGAAIEVLTMLPAAVKPGTRPILGAFTQASVYTVRMCFAYMVMLSVMSYNLGIFIAALSGHGIGFFIVKVRALANETEQQYMSPNGTPSKI